MLKKIALYFALMLWSGSAAAQVSYLEEVKALGTVAGQGLVCGSSKYDKFEMLARAILLTKAPNPTMLQKGIYAYTEAKANTYMAKQMDSGYLCGEIVERFDKQDIFQATLYEDGTIKMPDGAIITPKMPYDATQIYKKDDKLRENLKTVYDGGVKKASAKVMKKRGAASTSGQMAPKGAVAVNVQPSSVARQPRTVEAVDTNQDTTIGHIKRRY